MKKQRFLIPLTVLFCLLCMHVLAACEKTTAGDDASRHMYALSVIGA